MKFGNKKKMVNTRTKISSRIVMLLRYKCIIKKIEKKKKKTCRRMDFAVPVDHSVKIKENETIDKYFHIAR